jgi:WD40 repeat protein
MSAGRIRSLALFLCCASALPARGEAPGPDRPNSSPTRTDRYGDPLPHGAVARLGTARLRHAFPLHAVAFSADGKSLASAAASVRVWDVATGKELRHLAETEPNFMLDALAYSPDGKLLAYTGRGARVVRLADAVTGKVVHRLRVAGSAGVAFSPDGKHLASGGEDGLVHLWGVATGEHVRAWGGEMGGG